MFLVIDLTPLSPPPVSPSLVSRVVIQARIISSKINKKQARVVVNLIVD